MKQENHALPFPFDNIIEALSLICMHPDQRMDHVFLIWWKKKGLKRFGVEIDILDQIYIEHKPLLGCEAKARDGAIA